MNKLLFTAPGRAQLAGFASFMMLMSAYAFQHLGGLYPCTLCLWQRWPHAIAALLAVSIFFLPQKMKKIAIALGSITMLISVFFAGWHTGVEIGVLPGLSSCGSVVPNVSTEELAQMIANNTLPACDKVAWSFLGQSMAGWNLLISSVLLGLWLAGTKTMVTQSQDD